MSTFNTFLLPWKMGFWNLKCIILSWMCLPKFHPFNNVKVTFFNRQIWLQRSTLYNRGVNMWSCPIPGWIIGLTSSALSALIGSSSLGHREKSFPAATNRSFNRDAVRPNHVIPACIQTHTSSNGMTFSSAEEGMVNSTDSPPHFKTSLCTPCYWYHWTPRNKVLAGGPVDRSSSRRNQENIILQNLLCH